MSKKCWATKAPEGDTRAATECSCLPAGEPTGQQGVVLAPPQGWTYVSRSRAASEEGSVRGQRQSGHMWAPQAQLLRDPLGRGGRARGVNGTTHPLCLEHSTLLLPRSSASFLQEAPPQWVRPSSGLPHPEGFPPAWPPGHWAVTGGGSVTHIDCEH